LARLDDSDLAVEIAGRAAESLNLLRTTHQSDDSKKLRAEGDKVSQKQIAADLALARPNDAILSEEAVDDADTRLSADRVWIIDPLDGTREFAERTDGIWRDDFAVHVALWERGRGLTVGAVALPARNQIYSTRDTLPSRGLLSAEQQAPLRVAASRTRPPGFVAQLAEQGDIRLVPMGSAGVKIISVLVGDADAYVHGGGQYEWDSAAPVAVAQAAGLVCTRLDGSPLEYNRADPWLPDLLVTRPAYEPQLRELLRKVGI